MQDLRLACRSLVAAPIVSAVAILSIALGIGANTAIFSLVNALLLRPLPISARERLVSIAAARSQGRWTWSIPSGIRFASVHDCSMGPSPGRPINSICPLAEKRIS
jgi:hypothetical protein